MATAESTRRDVKKMVETTVQEDVVVLTLSKDEAEFLAEITYRHVSGSIVDSPRRHSDAILDALGIAGVDLYAISYLGKGQIHFDNYPEPEKPADDGPLKVGDRVRVVDDYACSSGFHRGDIVCLTEADGDSCRARGIRGHWYLKATDVERVTD